jgi:hypothetical protein
MSCKGRNVSDKKDKYYLPFYDEDNNPVKKFYHVAIGCKNKALKNSDLCGICSEKEQALSKYTIKNGVIKNPNGSSICHPSLLHGRIDGPIPEWSHIEDGVWFKKMLQKGYRKYPEEKMGRKIVVDEKKVNEAISKLKGKKDAKIEALRKLFPELSANAASKLITNFNKKETGDNKTIDTAVENVIESLKEKCYINDEEKKDVDDIKTIVVKPITIDGTKYYYNSESSKVYTTDYLYVGRYDYKQKIIDTTQPDSDAEPSFST